MSVIENQAGFTLSDSKLQLVEVVHNGEQFILENVNEAYFNDNINLLSNKDTKINALLQGAFDELQIEQPLKTSSVSFTLPYEAFNFMQIPYDTTLLYQDLVEEFRWEFSVLYPYLSTKNLVIRYFEVEKNFLLDKNTALVFAIQRKYLQMINQFCQRNNLKLKFVDNIHLAAERALSVSNAIVYKGLTVSVYFNSRFLSILFAFNGKPVHFKVIPLLDAGEIPDHLRKEISQSGFLNINRSLVEAAFISGAEISGTIVHRLSEIVGLEFILFNPFDKIKPNPNLYSNKFYLEKFNAFAPSAGIAFRAS